MRDADGPVVLHARTQKGHGYAPAEADPYGWHATKPFEISTGKHRPSAAGGPPSWTNCFADALSRIADRDPKVIAITAAMPDGTGLDKFARRHPDRTYDVGIAEQHAVTFAAGLAAEGLKPVPAIYSTFLQRAYDHLVHDVAVQHLPVIFCLDRAGIAGEDGPTHHGMLDLAYLSCVQGMVVAAPKDGNELRDLLFTALSYSDGPFAIRYPKDSSWHYDPLERYRPIPIGQWEAMRPGDDLCLLAVGSMVKSAHEVADRLAADGVEAEVVNARFVKPLDTAMMDRIAEKHRLVITIEEGCLRGGFGQAAAQELAVRNPDLKVRSIGADDRLIPHGARTILLDWTGLSVARLEKQIRGWLDALPAPARLFRRRFRRRPEALSRHPHQDRDNT
jgi:1-deoxy-D-xylulose-5-phosphate synthase